jgi:hypothetical protein
MRRSNSFQSLDNLWLCKDGDHKNEFLRLRLQYEWYLTLIFDLKRTA